MLHYVRIDQLLIGHQERAIVGDREGAEGALRRGVLIVGPFLAAQLGLLFDDVDLHLFQERRIAVGQPNLQIAGVVAVLVDHPRRGIEDVILPVLDDFAVDRRLAAAADAEVYLRRVVADRRGALAGL